MPRRWVLLLCCLAGCTTETRVPGQEQLTYQVSVMQLPIGTLQVNKVEGGNIELEFAPNAVAGLFTSMTVQGWETFTDGRYGGYILTVKDTETVTTILLYGEDKTSKLVEYDEDGTYFPTTLPFRVMDPINFLWGGAEKEGWHLFISRSSLLWLYGHQLKEETVTLQGVQYPATVWSATLYNAATLGDPEVKKESAYGLGDKVTDYLLWFSPTGVLLALERSTSWGTLRAELVPP